MQYYIIICCSNCPSTSLAWLTWAELNFMDMDYEVIRNPWSSPIISLYWWENEKIMREWFAQNWATDNLSNWVSCLLSLCTFFPHNLFLPCFLHLHCTWVKSKSQIEVNFIKKLCVYILIQIIKYFKMSFGNW